MIARVLIVEPRAAVRRRIAALLCDDAGRIVDACAPDAALRTRLRVSAVDLVVLGGLDQAALRDLVAFVARLPDAPEILVVTNANGQSQAARLVAEGAGVVIAEDTAGPEMSDVVDSLVERRTQAVRARLVGQRAIERPSLSDFVSASPRMQAFMQVVHRVASADTSLLLLGETGVGKERLARAIHAESRRGEGPFVAVNCGALPDTLLESELFGHEAGAFTGAVRARRGMFELAHGGTVFLDEVGEMPPHAQVSLLRVLQDGVVMRLGGERSFTIDVRVMAASNRDLEAEVEAGVFRRDLFYRLGVVTLTLPPLRERREDLALLVDSYLDHLSTRIGREVRAISPEALACLERYGWPGNVRELINVLERGILITNDDEITPGDLPVAISRLRPGGAATALALEPEAQLPGELLELPLAEVRRRVVDHFERAYLSALLAKTRGRIDETARRAGITPRALNDRMRHLGLRKEAFRGG